MATWRRLFGGLALITATAVVVTGCQVDGSAQPNAAAISAVQSAASASTAPSSIGGTTPPSSTSAPVSSTVPSSTSSSAIAPPSSPIEDFSTSNLPTGTTSPPVTSASGPTLVFADDGYSVSILVTTVWARALAAKGTKVGIRTIDEPVDQVSALKAGTVDLVQQYDNSFLDYLDKQSDAISQSDVDAAIAGKLPAGITALNSTPARDGVQLVVSATTAAKYQLHSISDLGDHLAALTLLFPSSSTSVSFAKGLSNYYGLTFPNTKTTDFGGPKTISAVGSSPSVGLMNTSQFQIDDQKFVALTDPEHLFFAENFIPVTSAKITPSMRSTINAASAKLTVAAVRGMRRAVATGQGTAAEVADAWLASVGLK